jgi:hypothetical protein
MHFAWGRILKRVAVSRKETSGLIKASEYVGQICSYLLLSQDSFVEFASAVNVFMFCGSPNTTARRVTWSQVKHTAYRYGG